MAEHSLSQQPRLANVEETFPYLLSMWQHTDDLPAWGAPLRTAKLREYVHNEPILSGAFSSMVQKACSLDWQVIGGRNRIKRFQELLAEAEDGKGWQNTLSPLVQDYWGTDLGGAWELARRTKNGPVEGVYNLDAECLTLTGSVSYPIRYTPKLNSGKLSKKDAVKLRPGDFARIVDLPSADEAKYTLGFCAVSRAIRASKVLLALYNYEEEKLTDMPMPGVVTVTGLTMGEVADAFALYQAHRDSKQQAIFKGLLWLAAQTSPGMSIDAKLVSFAGLPENFDKDQTFSLYIYTLALAWGVDAREFWPATQSGATKGEAEVQAQKAKGKGFGQMLSAVERTINWSILPSGIEFAFDRRNDDDDLAREIWRGQVISNVRKLWEPPAGKGAVAGMIDTEEARRMLVELQALPDWLAPSDNLTLHSQDRALPTEESHPMPDILKQEKPAPPPAPIVQKIDGQGNPLNPADGKNQPKGTTPPQLQKYAQTAQNAKLAQKALRADLDVNEDLAAINLSGETITLWSSRKMYLMPDTSNIFGIKATRDAAIAHLQAAGLLMTDGHTAIGEAT